MKGKYFKRIGGFILAALTLSGIAFVIREHSRGAGAAQSDCSPLSVSHLPQV